MNTKPFLAAIPFSDCAGAMTTDVAPARTSVATSDLFEELLEVDENVDEQESYPQKMFRMLDKAYEESKKSTLVFK